MKLVEVNFTFHSLSALFSLISYILGKSDKSDVTKRDMTFIPYSIKRRGIRARGATLKVGGGGGG